MIVSAYPEPSNEQLGPTQPGPDQWSAQLPRLVAKRHWLGIITGVLALLTIVFLGISAVSRANTVSVTGTVVSATPPKTCYLGRFQSETCYTYQVSYTLDGQSFTSTIADSTVTLSPGESVAILVNSSNHSARFTTDWSWSTMVAFCLGFFTVMIGIGFVGQAWGTSVYKRQSRKAQTMSPAQVQYTQTPQYRQQMQKKAWMWTLLGFGIVLVVLLLPLMIVFIRVLL